MEEKLPLLLFFFSQFSQNPRRAQMRLEIVFAFFSNRLGCLGSLIVSLIGTVILIVILRSCSGTSTW
jgi:hypothetical protein